MSFEYSKADLRKVSVGDKIVTRKGEIATVEGVLISQIQVGGFGYDFDGACFGIPERDAVWIVGTNEGPVDLGEYDLTEGLYAVNADGAVLQLTQVDKIDTSAPAKFALVGDLGFDMWYNKDGTRVTFSSDKGKPIVEVCAPKKTKLIPEVPVFQPPLNLRSVNLKVGDQVLLRNGSTQTVQEVDLPVFPYKIRGCYYTSNGVCNIDPLGQSNQLDVIALVGRSTPKDEGYFKDLALSLLGEVPADRLLTVPSSVVLEIIKDAHSDIEPNKVSTAFVALLEGFSRSNESVKLPAKALRDLISL